jgi:prepilin-type N-terminal cleavage/methylation domain-containing protein
MIKAFSVVELVIVVAVLGILAAIVVPHFQGHATEAKEAVAKDNLRVLRGAIELYAAQHSGVSPGYKDDNPRSTPSETYFIDQTAAKGDYLRKMPKNPFNNLDTMKVLANGQAFPAEATGESGWVYKPATKTIRLDWPGTDDSGLRYYDY